MRVGTSLVLIALGAILRFAVHATAKGVNVHTVGIILMIVGIVALILSLMWALIWADRVRRPAYVERHTRQVPVRRERDLY